MNTLKRPETSKSPVKKGSAPTKRLPTENSHARGGNRAKGGGKPAAATVAATPALAPDPDAGQKVVLPTSPILTMGTLPLEVRGTAPKPGHYSPGSASVRYWNVSDALRRAREVWRPHLSETQQWQGGVSLEVDIDGTDELNACYDRKNLSFLQGTVKGEVVHAADSPDVVAHEFGHALLDALRPDLWDAALDEVAAFHESFGDICALLMALREESVCAGLIKENGAHLFQSSSVSRFGAQFGRAVHRLNPSSAPQDCLRNAVNSFFYREPLHLPPMAPYTDLSSEPHSFSRIFTAGFFEGMGGMLRVQAAHPKAEDLMQVGHDAAAILAKAVRSAALSAAFFSEVAAQVIWADTSLFAGKYDEVLRSAFVRRGLLSLEAARSLKAEAARALNSGKPQNGGDEMPRGRDMMMRATAYGLGEGALVVRTASFSRRGMIASAAPDAGSTPVPGVEQATQSFLETIFRRGSVDFAQCKLGLSSVPHSHVKRKTHYLVEQNGQYHLRRRCFEEGFEDAMV